MLRRKQWIDPLTGLAVYDATQRFPDALNEDGYRFPAHKAGSRLFDDIKFPEGLLDDELGKMARLSKLMVGGTNMLGYRSNHQIVPYTIDEIGDAVGLQHWRGRKFVNRMCKLRIMQRWASTTGAQYYINPAYFMASGHRLSLDLFLLFRDELQDIVPQWVINHFLRQARAKQTSARTSLVGEAEAIVRGVDAA